MDAGIDAGWDHEGISSNVSWFGKLSMAERLEVLDELYEMAVSLDRALRGGRDDGQAQASVLVVEQA
jgi:hypothetical protein